MSLKETESMLADAVEVIDRTYAFGGKVWNQYVELVIDEVLGGNLDIVLDRQVIHQGIVCNNDASVKTLVDGIQWRLDERWRQQTNADHTKDAPYEVKESMVSQIGTNVSYQIISFIKK